MGNNHKMRRIAVGGIVVLSATALVACSGAGGTGAGGGGEGTGDSINVLMVNNSQMLDLQKNIDDFTSATGVKVNFTVKEEGEMRSLASQDFANQAGQFDVATLSNFEIPFYSKNGWLHSMDDIQAYKDDKEFNQADIFPSMTNSLKGPDGKLYGEPFYGESSFLMYRKDLADKAGVKISANPTWDEVATAAAKLDTGDTKGICLRGKPGWGDVMAPLTSVVNTFGGTWFEKDWTAKVNAPEFKEATTFYTDLIKKHGEAGAAQASFNQCLSAFQQGKVAMWYDATSGAGKVEADDSPIKGKVAYVQAPVKETKSSGWLYAWSWAIEKKSTKQEAAWKFVSWASSQKYEELAGSKQGWANVPAGKRTSTYANPEYRKAAEAFADATLEAIQSADPTNPGVQPRPTVGIQFVDVPEFTDVGQKVSEDVSAVIAGQKTVDEALDAGQTYAEQKITKVYRGK
jgi:sorbitol/mannitol transport system substrate-binding protein